MRSLRSTGRARPAAGLAAALALAALATAALPGHPLAQAAADAACSGGVLAALGSPPAIRCLRPGDVFRDCAEPCPEMVVVPAGSFLMGSPEGEADRSEDEGPLHRVAIAAPFAVARLEVTRGAFAAFVAETGYAPPPGCHVAIPSGFADGRNKTFRDPAFAQDDRHPAVCVSHDDADAFLAWLTRQAGTPYRLLSEAEWEYAARAGNASDFAFGAPERQCAAVNAADLAFEATFAGWEAADCDDGAVYTAPGGSYPPNAFGLHDMTGNVWEWTADCYHEDYTGAPADGTPWLAGECRTRVSRGGSFVDAPRYLRPAYRDGNPPDARFSVLGFRVARSLTR
ncbi:MAG: formylglycine-generating enzyme family protein [Bauldia sp.]